ncbi:MAG: hypothetical protein IJT91_05785 [Clostridia bacterium]|nr:hypothetical protein [Clostridia bacterium]
MKLRALVTAEINKEKLINHFADSVDFVFDGYYIDHNVMPHDELKEKIKYYDILICEYDTITKEIFDAAEKLKIVICCRGGVSAVVDLGAAMKKGVIVCNNAGRNAGAVTDMVMGYILDLTRNITKTNNLIFSKILTGDVSTKPKEYVDTVWGLDNDSPFIKYRGRSINHMSLGIIGFGHAGRMLADKANAFGMKILAYDPYSEFENKPDYVTISTWDNIISSSDIISLHCILTPQTENMFSKEVFEKMKPDSIFINTSRGQLVVEEDLVNALNSGVIAAAALDVTAQEPIPADSVLLKAKHLLITPHIAGSSDDVQYCGTKMVINCIEDFINNKKPKHCVVYK